MRHALGLPLSTLCTLLLLLVASAGPLPAQPCDDPDGDDRCDPDNCPTVYNPDQLDCDHDGFGEACDPCSDCDGDGDPDHCVPSDSGDDCCPVSDNCPEIPNANQADGDGDGRGDVCDNCPAQANGAQSNFDGDPMGDACDPDDDDDGVLDAQDCAQLDASTWTRPGRVRDLRLSKGVVTRLRWSETDPDDHYDLCGGSLSDLRAAGGMGNASCVANDVAGETWDDTRPDPAAGAGHYSVVRAQSTCGNGSYGTNSTTGERQPGADCP